MLEPKHLLRNAKLKVTLPRLTVLKILQESPKELIYAELSGDFPLGDSRQPTYKSLRPFDLVS